MVTMRKIGLALVLAVAILAILLTITRGRTGGPEAPRPNSDEAGAALPGHTGSSVDELDAVVTEAIDPRRTGRLRIVVAGREGPVPDAGIEVRPAKGPALELRTDERGIAFLDSVPAGMSDVRSEADGFAPDDSRASVPLGGLVIVEVLLRHSRVLTGTVVRPDDVPVPDARVRLFEPAGVYMDGEAWEHLDDLLGEARTGADGRFRADALPGSYTDSALFLVSAEGFRTTLFFGEDGIRIPLAPGGVLEGRVADGDGRPIAGARVVAVPATHRHLWREDVASRTSFASTPTASPFASAG